MHFNPFNISDLIAYIFTNKFFLIEKKSQANIKKSQLLISVVFL
jgi:hypothetical protein